MGLGITYALPWAMMTCVASGFALWSFSLLSVVALARVAVALSVGVGVLRDGQVLRDLWLLPLRDFFGLWFWAWSFAGGAGSSSICGMGEYRMLQGRYPPPLPGRKFPVFSGLRWVMARKNVIIKGLRLNLSRQRTYG